ncbi:MAG: GTPase HflX [Calditrichaeota bacterium]|nr:GTPase HflX [Calditrichota bacterium]
MQIESLNSQNAVLVGLRLPGQDMDEIQEHLSELEQLANTAGLNVKDKLIQERDRVHVTYFIGPGKVSALNDLLIETDSKIVVFDEDLGPAQIRNLEKSLNVKVIDRSTLILDIFARHARTREAKTQVELAQLQYLLPRLTRQWTHLSRQVGGIGTRGPGETQLETDRRLIRTRIEKLRTDLQKIDRHQAILRQNRQQLFRISLVGYTNVGKSTLMNLLSEAEVLVENQLFATLDSIVRKVNFDDEHDILLSDTVGFIRKLPAHLVASFKSTLDEVREADLLLHVVDASHAFFREQMDTVMKIIGELDAKSKPILTVFNKIDLLDDLAVLQSLRQEFPDAVFLSAARQIGLESLRKKIIQSLEQNFLELSLEVPVKYQKFIHYIHSNCRVEGFRYEDSTAIFHVKCDRDTYGKIKHIYEDINQKSNNDEIHEEAMR